MEPLKEESGSEQSSSGSSKDNLEKGEEEEMKFDNYVTTVQGNNDSPPRESDVSINSLANHSMNVLDGSMNTQEYEK